MAGRGNKASSNTRLSTWDQEYIDGIAENSVAPGAMYLNIDDGDIYYVDADREHRRVSRDGTFGGILKGQVATYASLPTSGNTLNDLYWVRNTTGSQWLPGSLGGTYRRSGVWRMGWY